MPQATNNKMPMAPLPTINPNGTPIVDMNAEIERRGKELFEEFKKSQFEIWQITAPVGDRNNKIWKHTDRNTGEVTNRYNPSEAQRDGTWEIQIPEHVHHDFQTGKDTKVKDQVVPMVSGIARTADKYAALWVQREFGYEIKKLEQE